MTTVAFFPEGAYGPTNNCVGIGDVLRGRGVRVVFIVEESFAGTLEAKGFEERLMRLAPAPEIEEEPGQFWKDFIRDTAPVFRRPTFEQLGEFIQPTWQALLDGARYVEPRLREILEEVRPDVVVEDNVLCFPAVVTSGAPWVRIVSCNPLELKDPKLPPPYSGLLMEERERFADYRAEYRRTHESMWREFDEWVRSCGADRLPELEFIQESPWLDLYLYPEELDYPRSRPLAPVWHRLESCVRATDEPWEPPAGEGPLVYLSLGSLGAADVELMQGLIDALADRRWRIVVSMGPQHHELRLAENMTGAELLPQVSLLPHVDLVITHGGNNTVSECLHFGKPMLVLPIFWDQHDNGARVHETGFGGRIPTYSFDQAELVAEAERLLADAGLRERLGRAAARLQGTPGTVRAADLIERLAREKEPLAA